LIYEYMFRYFPDQDKLIKPKKEVKVSPESTKLAKEIFEGNNSSHDYKSLQKAVRNVGETIPPMFNAYIGLTETMRMFGSIIDHDFGSVYETGIMVTMGDLLDTKRKRYIEPYIEYLKIIINEKEKNLKLARAKRREARQVKKDKKNQKK
ncbi:MAG TPA: hemolysin, partial [Paludibacter sp.]|nr:hemolysin [Paludibacter sp.]